MSKPDQVDGLLFRALHRYRRSGERWAALRSEGASDKDLAQRVGDEFGSFAGFGGSGDTGASFDGGPRPRFWIGRTPAGKPDLEGQELIDRVRRVMRIPRPAAAPDQGALFADEA